MTVPTSPNDAGGYTGKPARRLRRLAGLGCGLIYTLAYALAAWGFDARLLARSNAELAWVKLQVGLPLLLLIGALTGALASRSRRPGVWVGAWMVSGALVGAIAGQMPFAGHNLAVWIAEPRLRGTNVFPMVATATARMIFAMIVTACTWAAIGLAGYLLLESVRKPASPPARLSGRPWVALPVALALAVLPGLVADEIVNRPLRVGLQAVHTTIVAGEGSVSGTGEYTEGEYTEDSDPAAGSPLPPAGYTLHLVDYAPAEYAEGEHEYTEPPRYIVDVALRTPGVPTGLVVRCQVSDRASAGADEGEPRREQARRREQAAVGYSFAVSCVPFSPQLEEWMTGLIQQTLENEPYIPDIPLHPSVDQEVLDWLASQREYMSGRYEISRDAQYGGWVIMSIRFDTGHTLACYFHGGFAQVLDHCGE